MLTSKQLILADMGGTHIRLARQGVKDAHSYTIADWPSLSHVLRDYTHDLAGHHLLMSFAKKADETGTYTLDQPHKHSSWSFSNKDICDSLRLTSMTVLHDLHAAGYAVFHDEPDLFEPLTFVKSGTGTRIIISVGTGLGHAYINPETKTVHDTFGGHMPPIAITQDQREAIRFLQTGFPPTRTFVFEEILSGRGYHTLLSWDQDKAPRLFAEFLGLYANMLAISGHAFGGIYLIGGMIEHLKEANAFDVESFNRFFILENVPLVDDQLRKTPLWRANLSHTTLYGLDHYAQSLSND